MKNFSTVGEWLVHNQHQHSELSLYYSTLSMACTEQRSAMLLATLADHEKQLALELVRYVEQASDCVLNTFVQFDLETDLHTCMSAKPGEPLTIERVAALALCVDEFFAELYTGLSRAADTDKVKDLFDNLLAHINEEKKRLSIDVYSAQDM